jgi:hypothetical protein
MRANNKINILTNLKNNLPKFDKKLTISCKDCIYYVAPFLVHDNLHDFSRCRKIMYKDIDNDILFSSFTQMNRQFDHLCGPDAKYKKTTYVNSNIDKESIIIHPIKIN